MKKCGGSIEALLEKFKDLKTGDEITLTIETLLGGSTEVKATYRRNLKQRGFVKPNWRQLGIVRRN